ncbi:sensor histidine kinase [Actinacidiphila yeochonensis]|uniref:sensor histidine kinase n=1 Tax=Actinacidiphila yeochonensis TaxID=89050 RepID=UPI0005670B4A|nr:histidine kinase [Actinacidiphila yeochonensis]
MSTTGARVPGDVAAVTAGRRLPSWWWWARRRGFLLDAALAAVSAVEASFEGATFAGRVGAATWLGALLGMLVGAVLLLRRRWPMAVVLVGVAVTPAQTGYLLSLAGLYTLAASEVPRRLTSALAGVSGLGTMLVAYVNFEHSLRHSTSGGRMSPPLVLIVSVLMALGLTGPPVLLGLYVRARRRLVESLRDRADGLERELELLAEKALERAERARAAERARIAREMHDVVAHRVSLMVVHAAALKAVALKDPQKASAGAELVGDMGRQALAELRQMLGVLRSEGGTAGAAGDGPALSGPADGAGEDGRDRADGEGTDAGAYDAASRAGGFRGNAAGSGTAPSAVGATAAAPAADGLPGDARADGRGAPRAEVPPGPSLAQLGQLVRESQQAGMGVELAVEGDERPCGQRVEATVYRVVQEALTNVRKHAAGATAQVRLAYREAEVAVLIVNGPACQQGTAPAALPGGGHGLLGMRERVTAHGGGFAAGPTPDGGFRVSAMVPLRVV